MTYDLDEKKPFVYFRKFQYISKIVKSTKTSTCEKWNLKKKKKYIYIYICRGQYCQKDNKKFVPSPSIPTSSPNWSTVNQKDKVTNFPTCVSKIF